MRIASPAALDVHVRNDFLRGTVRVTNMKVLPRLPDANAVRLPGRIPHHSPETLEMIVSRFATAKPVHDDHISTLAPEYLPLPVHTVVTRGFRAKHREFRAVATDV